MLDKYIDGQANVYNMLVKQNNNNKLSHAYLIDANGNDNAVEIIKDFCKFLICPNKYFSVCTYNDCDICRRIDNMICDEFRIVKPDGLWIKKEQILTLQKEFWKKSSNNLRKMYIITEASKLNLSAANTLLKFLEEPEDNIIAFLVTDNVNMVLETIKSRCQYIKLNNSKCAEVPSCKEFDKLLSFIDYLEINKEKTIIHEKDKWLNYFASRNDAYEALCEMVNIYNMALRYTLDKNIRLIEKYESLVLLIVSLNTKDMLIKKLSCLMNFCDDVRNNVNVNLLLDNLIFIFGGV